MCVWVEVVLPALVILDQRALSKGMMELSVPVGGRGDYDQTIYHKIQNRREMFNQMQK